MDQPITENAKRRSKSVSFMWINYKKAYNSVPHSWLTKILDMYKIDDTTSGFINHLMPFWRTKIYLPYKSGCV